MVLARSWWLVASLVAGCRAGGFACDEPTDCAVAGDAGTCQPEGWCSFPADDCPSGQRYGEHAGDGLAGVCVDTTDDTTTSATTFEDATMTTSLVTSDADTNMTTTIGVETSESLSVTSEDPTTDDMSTTEPDGFCGDGIVERGEQCDAGPDNGGGNACRTDCLFTTCGDGYVGGDEQCDPSVDRSCTASCTFLSCGNGQLEPGEECDPLAPVVGGCQQLGFVDGQLVCSSRCTYSTLGCDGCDDSCDFPPCNDACPTNEHCVRYGGGQVCTAACDSDADCPSGYDGVLCENGECVIPCEFTDDCPVAMMACFGGHCAYAI